MIAPVSAYTANIIEEHYRIESEKINILHNGIKSYPAYRINPPFESALVVYLGRLTGQKGPEYFFEAAKLLLEDRVAVHFVIAGRGHLIEDLTRKAAEAGLGHRIISPDS